MEISDFHLRGLKEEVVGSDETVRCEVLLRPGTEAGGGCGGEGGREIVKLVKWSQRPEKGPLAYSPPVFVLVRKPESSTVQIQLMSYNEEVLEDLSARVVEDLPMDSSLSHHILNSLNRTVTVCSGVEERDWKVRPDLSTILIEKYGDKILFRSVMCSRIVVDSTTLCYECNLVLGESRANSEQLPVVNQRSKAIISNQSEDMWEGESYPVFSTSEPSVTDKLLFMPELFPHGRDERPLNDAQQAGDSGGGAPRGKWRETQRPATGKKQRESMRLCDVGDCRAEASSASLLASHILEDHPEVKHSLLKHFSKCPVSDCYKVFRGVGEKSIKSHLKKQHPDFTPPPKESSHTCTVCGKTFRSHRFLKSHINGVHEAASLPCHICGALIKGNIPLSVHIKVVHGKAKFSCPEPGCDVTAKNRDHIKDHIAAIHKKEPRYVCSGCGTRFKYRNKWKYCEDKHNGKFLHRCSQCDKKFNDKIKFEMHLRVHTGEKPYSCPICGIRMARIDNLNAHTKKSHGVTRREAERMSNNAIAVIPLNNPPLLESPQHHQRVQLHHNQDAAPPADPQWHSSGAVAADTFPPIASVGGGADGGLAVVGGDGSSADDDHLKIISCKQFLEEFKPLEGGGAVYRITDVTFKGSEMENFKDIEDDS